MTDPASRWHELSQRLEALALKLKLHAEQARDGGDTSAVEAMQSLRAAFDEAFRTAAAVAKDDAVRENVRDVGRLLTEAVSTTLGQAGQDVRDLFERKSPTG
jgi:hypothetical protein